MSYKTVTWQYHLVVQHYFFYCDLILSYSAKSHFLTFLRHVRPLGVGELVLPHPDPLLHARRDGQAVVGVERRVSTQPADEKRGGATSNSFTAERKKTQ